MKGDLNAKIGRSCSGDVVGDFGLGSRKVRGDKLHSDNTQVMCILEGAPRTGQGTRSNISL